ncbi:PIN domain-containing protein [Pseudomonas aeruginosa]
MLDTNVCAKILRERSPELLALLTNEVNKGNRFVISATTYAALRTGALRHPDTDGQTALVDAFVQRLDGVLAVDAAAVDGALLVATVLHSNYMTGLLTPESWVSEEDAFDQAAKPGHTMSVLFSDREVSEIGHALVAKTVLVTDRAEELKFIRALKSVSWNWERIS